MERKQGIALGEWSGRIEGAYREKKWMQRMWEPTGARKGNWELRE